MIENDLLEIATISDLPKNSLFIWNNELYTIIGECSDDPQKIKTRRIAAFWRSNPDDGWFIDHHADLYTGFWRNAEVWRLKNHISNP
jgi:hypothetical protein